ncbi:thioredoxin domain-containing protein [Candidatus Falkowbacteria bacterium]|nr:thioredoxin domain-containing protein [Candidatus Falkowbacteria bacterium]NCT55123.1 thioredoxin domain-containing protein [Candidatus Falkowbacteria bacterium]
MFANKIEKDYKNKKYLLVVVILMIIAALGLSVANLLGKDLALKNTLVDLALEKEVEVGNGNYLVTTRPEMEATDMVLGSKNAKLKIFVYEDYDDLFSTKLASDLDRLLIEKGNDLAIVFRPFIGFSENSANYALALDCVSDLGDWQALRKKLMINLEGQTADDSVIDQDNILDENLVACLTEKEKSGRIEELKKEALDYQVFGSPTLFIGDEMVLGARPYEDYLDSSGLEVEGLKSLVDRVLGE